MSIKLKLNIIRIGCWNILSWYRKKSGYIIGNEQTLGICGISESKKKGQGTPYSNYILMYNVKPKDERNTFRCVYNKHYTEYIECVNDRIIQVSLKV